MWTRRRIVTGWIVLAVWIVAVLVWAMRPATDHVPTGVVDGVATSIAVECGAPLDRSPGPAEPFPFLEPPRAPQHIPCEAQHRSNQISLVIDAVVAVAAATLLVWAGRRRRRRGQPAVPSREPISA